MDEADQAAEGGGMRFVHRLQDDLPQPLLALGGQQQVFDDFPSFRPAGGQKGPGYMSTHQPPVFVSPGGGGQEGEQGVTFREIAFYYTGKKLVTMRWSHDRRRPPVSHGRRGARNARRWAEI